MSVRAVSRERRLCDRPGCDNVVTAKGELSVGLSIENGVCAVEVIDAVDGGSTIHAPDLCHDCHESLISWWGGKDRRAQARAEREGARL